MPEAALCVSELSVVQLVLVMPLKTLLDVWFYGDGLVYFGSGRGRCADFAENQLTPCNRESDWTNNHYL